MNIMVFDVPAVNGGALTILKQYYEQAVNDNENKWFFVVSIPSLVETDNVKVFRYPWVKKSWIHRLYFDKFIAKRIVEKHKVDEVLSLQNVIIKKLNVKQILYLHQPLPFVEKRYKITNNFKFWVYQNIISKIIFESIKQADSVIVQTNWMKNACIEKVDINPKKIKVKQPEISIVIKVKHKQEDDENKLFFYPASGLTYKNHRIIVEAVSKLNEQKITNYKVIFTLSGNENKNVNKLYRIVEEYNLPIKFIGQISIEEVHEYYSKSILIFPSYIETFGLPLLEAKMYGCPIIASDCAFCHEILDEYEDCCFFDPFSSEALGKLIQKFVIKKSSSFRKENNYVVGIL